MAQSARGKRPVRMLRALVGVVALLLLMLVAWWYFVASSPPSPEHPLAPATTRAPDAPARGGLATTARPAPALA